MYRMCKKFFLEDETQRGLKYIKLSANDMAAEIPNILWSLERLNRTKDPPIKEFK